MIPTFAGLISESFTYQKHTISYLQIGDGEHLILAFHGFGMDKSAFKDFHSLVRPDQKFVSVDLFGHGNSVPKDLSGISRIEWQAILSAFLNHLSHDRFSLMAYSLGGKVVLETVNLFAKQIDQLLLLAADGFKRVKFYEFLSLSPIGRWVYRRVLSHPSIFLGFVDFITRVKILPLKLNKFVHYHIGNKERRELVYDVYRIYRNFIPDTALFHNQIFSNQITITFIYGEHDRVIHHSLGEKFIKAMHDKSLAKIHLLDKGHLILDSETAAYIKKNNLWFSN